jgi:hypothetical protein
MGPLEVQIWRLSKWPGHSLLFPKPSSLILEDVLFISCSLSYVPTRRNDKWIDWTAALTFPHCHFLCVLGFS